MAAPSSSSANDAAAPVRPAVVFHDAGGAGLRVAALPLLDRLLVTIHRAGFGPITVVSPAGTALPPLPRTAAWRIPFEVRAAGPVDAEAATSGTLIAGSGVIVTTADLRRLAERGTGCLNGTSGEALPVGIVAAGMPVRIDSLDHLPSVEAEGVAFGVRTREEARVAEAALWRSLSSSADGLVDRYFNRPAGRPLSRLLIRTPITPNMISVGATLLGVIAALLFALGSRAWSIVAAVVFQVSAIVDCVDGDVARAVFKESKLGKWLDLVGDQVVHLGVFAGIATGLWRSGVGPHVGWLGLSAVAGAAISFVVVMRGMRRAAESGRVDGTLQRMLDAATNRDFSVLVLGLACVEWLEGFLWMAAVGGHIFWMTLLALQVRRDPAGRGGR